MLHMSSDRVCSVCSEVRQRQTVGTTGTAKPLEHNYIILRREHGSIRIRKALVSLVICAVGWCCGFQSAYCSYFMLLHHMLYGLQATLALLLHRKRLWPYPTNMTTLFCDEPDESSSGVQSSSDAVHLTGIASCATGVKLVASVC
ncbi:hypothetical protein IG631_10769 [Alternaria alternata]|nr:hypothetical protein IG631_10769 [Alternaria alternata]